MHRDPPSSVLLVGVLIVPKETDEQSDRSGQSAAFLPLCALFASRVSPRAFVTPFSPSPLLPRVHFRTQSPTAQPHMQRPAGPCQPQEKSIANCGPPRSSPVAAARLHADSAAGANLENWQSFCCCRHPGSSTVPPRRHTCAPHLTFAGARLIHPS